MEKNRYLTPYIISDLAEKMVFIGGPRQVGKTTLAAKLVAPQFNGFTYYNWDNRHDRKQILADELPSNSELLIYDEIHKYRKWKTLLKGLYDSHKEQLKFLVTGSARLNIYRKGGDSLLGRYHYYTLHPFTLAEMINKKNDLQILKSLPIEANDHYEDFLTLDRFGGFPAILLGQSEKALRRWHNEKIDRYFREDIRDLEPVRDIGNLQLLADMLPQRVGSLLSINALREDLEVSHRAVTHWLNILEQFYYHFRIYPYHQRKIRSIKKEPKLYLVDWSEISDEAARFENLIASHLLKLVHFLYEHEGYKTELHYMRNVDKKEIDFLITVAKKPWLAVEAKLQDTEPSPSLHYFNDRLKIPFLYQVIKKRGVDHIKNNVRIVSADRFLASLI
jgi:uncharacterized protein